MRAQLSALVALGTALIVPAGCAAPTGQADLPGFIPEGKADNYFSDVSFEFEITGAVPITLTDAELADEHTRNLRIEQRLTAVALYLTTFVTDKFRGIDINGDGQISDDEVFFHNVDYGGFHAMVRNYSLEPGEVVDDGAAGRLVKFTVDMAGPKDLLAMIPRLPGVDVAGDVAHFSFQMPAGATVTSATVPRGSIRRFDPSTYDGALEEVRCSARQLPEPSNAYPPYAEFVADGVYDITLFYGHDYNESRSDLREAEEAYDTLVNLGFEAPAATFDDLAADSGPFVREAQANGAPIIIEVRVFHSEMFTTDRRGQHDLALSEITQRDVFFYNGHAGPYYGFYLDADGAAKVDYTEFAAAAFDPDRQQLFMAQGCQTYSQYADMVYASPAKNEENLDVIVTVNYSYGTGTMSVLRNLVQVDRFGNHQPIDYGEIVGDLNAEWINRSRDVFYGVTGIDGNTQVHPYGNVELAGTACSAPTDCGDMFGNQCVRHMGSTVCATVALGADACPDGLTFGHVPSVGGRTVGVCIRNADTDLPPPPPIGPVEGAVTPSMAGDLVISELMVNPKGLADSEGEWLEIYNPTDALFDLGGCVIGDNYGSGHTIDASVLVPAGGYITLARTDTPGFSPDYVYGDALQLSNKKDHLALTCDGVGIDNFSYNGRIRAGRSMSLSADSLDADLNDQRGVWCDGIGVYLTTSGQDDLGTPGAANAGCF